MDFAQRGAQHQGQSSGVAPASSSNSAAGGKGNASGSQKWNRIAFVALFVSVAVVLLGLIFTISTAKDDDQSEEKYVTSGQYQAVFLNGGQVYFGQITNLNSKYVRVQDIYYLRVNQTVQPNQANAQSAANDVSLVKLGCELHGPQDEMLINREQVIFWENLKSDGQVAKAVVDYKKQNPNGQKCDAPAAAAGTTTPAADAAKKN